MKRFFKWIKSLFQTEVELADHKISLPGIEIVVCPVVKVMFMVDQTGAADDYALSELSKWLNRQGYFLHGVAVGTPHTTEEKES